VRNWLDRVDATDPQHPALRPAVNIPGLLVAVTDGLPTRPLRPGGDPVQDTLVEARALRRARVPVVVADTGPEGRAAELAEAAGGVWMPAERLSPAKSRRGGSDPSSKVLSAVPQWASWQGGRADRLLSVRDTSRSHRTRVCTASPSVMVGLGP